MVRVLAVIFVVALFIYAVVELAQSKKYDVRIMPKWLWFVAICFPGIGPVCWLVFGRPVKDSAKKTRQQIAPDDDPDFLRRLH